MAIASATILSSLLETSTLNISTTLLEDPEALPDFIAFNVVDTMLCVITGRGSSTAGKFSSITASH